MSVSTQRGLERMLALFYQYKWQKFNKLNEKINLGDQNVGAEYVTGQINISIDTPSSGEPCEKTYESLKNMFKKKKKLCHK